ncbi:OmpA family protein [Enterovirga sp.]|jgi:outer membrane protein OmpA-like peptidoglycan-associated protein|uniref:OmpA family protein n=1 Tax=Enterovirga sp. TaxID=2026350 RepID=UPI00262B8D9B|nr:OmpA family protein [Enterovirga sp.]MDB5590168.1 OmpA/MotB domain protein [Enterovirga sp.]
MAAAFKAGARGALALAGAICTLGLSLSVAVAQAPTAAQAPTEGQIVDALTPKPVTRSLSGGPRPGASSGSPEEAAFLETLRSPTTRSLSVGQRDRLAGIAEGKPTIDLDVPFDLNSSVISAKARPAVDALGAALSRPEFKDGTFMIAGHTDALGSDQINQVLSERRAAAVKQYLTEKYKLPAKNFITAGYGKTRLKNKDKPTADENRRVQTTNLSEVKSASR